MKPLPVSRVIVAALLACVVRLAAAPETNAPVHVVTRGVIKVKAQFDAVAEAIEAEPIKFSPKSWMDLTVIEAVAHGSRVKKGDLLVKLDVDKLRDQIEDLEADRPASSLTMELAQAELENLRQTTPQKLDAAKRAKKNASDDYTYFENTGRPSREKNAKFMVKSSEQRLMGANEELKQLEKMYKADDLTEETEEIVLKRQRFAVEAAEFSLQNSREFAERELKSSLPREYETLKNAKRDQELALSLAEITVPKALTKKQLDFEKLKRDQQKAERKLNDLRYDLDMLTQRAPMDGVAYYGACENGRWTTGAMLGKKLVPGGKLMPNEIVMTIVNPERLRLRAVVSEADLGNYTANMKGEATPLSSPNNKLPVRLDDISLVPLPGGGFDATLSLTKNKSVSLLPGMTCKVAFTGIEKKVAAAVPKSAVFSDPTSKFVYVQKKDGSNEKRIVKTGESDDSLIEITEGVSEGDKVLLKKPEQG
jgi:multidrug efflux pump subunit AcrA (membrane-fusion protein)